MRYLIALTFALALFSCNSSNDSGQDASTKDPEATQNSIKELRVDTLTSEDREFSEGESYTLSNNEDQPIMTYNETTKTGRIKLDGTLLRVKRMDRTQDGKKFMFYGDDLEIVCNSVEWVEGEGEGDCSEALCSSVDIKFKNDEIGVPFVSMVYCYIGGF